MGATTPAMSLERRSVDKSPAKDSSESKYIDSFFIMLPVSAIVEHIQATHHIHHLLDSYHILHLRLTTLLAHHLIDSIRLQGLKQYDAAFIAALRRDILPVNQDPSSLLASDANTSSITSHYRCLEEAVSLSHIALQCSALILHHQCLSSLLSETAVSTLLTCVLAILNSNNIRTPNQVKTYAHLTHVICNQRLSLRQLGDHVPSITLCIKRMVENLWGEKQRVQGLRSVHSLLDYSVITYLPAFSEHLLAPVLSALLSSSREIRFAAAHGLSGFSLAALDSSTAALPKLVRETVVKFLLTQMSTSQAGTRADSLPSIMKECLRNAHDDTEDPWSARRWVASVIGSLVILAGPALFKHGRIMKSLAGGLRELALNSRGGRSTKPLAIALWAGVSRCMVWAYIALLSVDTPSHGEQDEARAQRARKRKEDAFKFVISDLEGGIGLTVVGSLLSRKSGDVQYNQEACNALRTIAAMFSHVVPAIRAEGYLLLAALFRSYPTESRSQELKTENIPPRHLFTSCTDEGTAPSDLLQLLLSDCKRFDVGQVRCLHDNEIIEHWDMSLDLWHGLLRHFLSSTSDTGLQDGTEHDLLIAIWNRLLPLHVYSEHSVDLSSTRHSLLSPIADLGKGQAMNESTQCRILGLLKDLWQACSILSPASTHTRAIADYLNLKMRDFSFDLKSSLVRQHWMEMCVSLNSAHIDGPGDATKDHKCLADLDVDTRAEVLWSIWITSALRHKSGDPMSRFEVLDAGIKLPTMSHESRQLWMRLYKMMDQKMWDTMSTKLITDLISAQKMLRILVSDMVLPHNKDPENLLLAINDAGSHVYKCYKSDKRLGHLWLQGVHWLLRGSVASDLVSSLTALQPSLVAWITDEEDRIAAEEYNSQVMPIYVDTLGRLDVISMTYTTLDGLTNFFISPFQRKEIPKPGRGPTAFVQFFDRVFAYAYPTTKTCPKSIRQYLIIHAGATGRDVPDDFPSSDTHMEENDTDPAPTSPYATPKKKSVSTPLWPSLIASRTGHTSSEVVESSLLEERVPFTPKTRKLRERATLPSPFGTTPTQSTSMSSPEMARGRGVSLSSLRHLQPTSSFDEHWPRGLSPKKASGRVAHASGINWLDSGSSSSLHRQITSNKPREGTSMRCIVDNVATDWLPSSPSPIRKRRGDNDNVYEARHCIVPADQSIKPTNLPQSALTKNSPELDPNNYPSWFNLANSVLSCRPSQDPNLRLPPSSTPAEIPRPSSQPQCQRIDSKEGRLRALRSVREMYASNLEDLDPLEEEAAKTEARKLLDLLEQRHHTRKRRRL